MPRPTAPISLEAQLRLLRRLTAHRPFRSMLARQGIALGAPWWRGSEDTIVRALDACSHCAESQACRAWLERAPRHEPYPGFCPNAKVIEVCRILALEPQRPDEAPTEPSLAAILSDDIVEQLMSADHVETAAVWSLLCEQWLAVFRAPAAEPERRRRNHSRADRRIRRAERLRRAPQSPTEGRA
jgi:hypothetical protein